MSLGLLLMSGMTGTAVLGFVIGWTACSQVVSKKLGRLSRKYEIARLAAETWRSEVEDLAKKVKED